MQKHHSCLNTRAIIEYFEERYPDAVSRLLAGLSLEIGARDDPRDFLKEINNWVSSEVVIQMFDNARRITRMQDIAYEIGFGAAARKKLGYVQRIIMFAHKNPRRALKRVQAINDKFNKNKVIEVLATTRDRATIRLHWFPEISGVVDFCRFNQGIYSGLPTIWGLPPAQVHETSCFFRGDDYCEYHLTWQKRTSWRESLRRSLAPWTLLKTTIEELERDKELLKHKFSEIHHLNVQLKERINQLLCLQETGTAALSRPRMERLLPECLEMFIKFTRMDRACLFLLDEPAQALVLQGAAGIDPELVSSLKGYRTPLSQGDNLLVRVAGSGNPTVIAAATAGELGLTHPLFHLVQPHAGVLAPLTARGKVMGVLWVDALNPARAITVPDQEFVMSFANQLAIALENAVLYGRLELSERKYRELVENAHEGIWIMGAGGVITFANRRMREITGMDHLEGKHLSMLADAPNLELWEKVLDRNRQGDAVQEELVLITPHRGQVTVLMSSVPLMEDGRFLGACAMFSDLRDQKEMEKQLLQHQKIEALGVLAGGIAHNFNNILMNIMGLTGLLLADTDEHAPAYADLQQIEQEAIKGTALTKQLLSVGRRSKLARQPLDLHGLIDQTVKLFCRTRKEVVITRQLTPDLPAVVGNQGLLEQVLLNLLVNAWQAMGGKGQMTVATEVVELPKDICRLSRRRPGRYVHLTLTDAGVGMDEDTTTRIFEPFFTTRETGQGTGMGLATAYAIIDRHQGIIRVESTRGLGTTFHIYLPVSPQPAVPPASPGDRLVPGTGTVLLVDDEENIRMVGSRMLEKLGYQVLVAADGAHAVSLYQTHRDRIDLVMLDLVMPAMDGAETYKKLREINPQVQVLLASGYCLDGAAQELIRRGARDFLQKPYRIEHLSQKVAAVLQSRSPAKPGEKAGLKRAV